MAGKAGADADAKAGIGARIMGLLVPVCFVLSLVSLTALFVAAIDFGFMNLTMMVSKFAIVALGLLIVTMSLGEFASMKRAASERNAAHGQNVALQDRLEAKMKAVEEKFNGYLGEQFNELKSANEAMKGQLEQIASDEEEKQKLEDEKLKEEYERLKQHNLELQEQLQQTSITLSQSLNSPGTETAAENNQMPAADAAA